MYFKCSHVTYLIFINLAPTPAPFGATAAQPTAFGQPAAAPSLFGGAKPAGK